MLADPEVGDHFMLDLYNKVIPHFKLKNIGLFFISSLRIFFSGCLHVFAKKKKNLIFSFRLNRMG